MDNSRHTTIYFKGTGLDIESQEERYNSIKNLDYKKQLIMN